MNLEQRVKILEENLPKKKISDEYAFGVDVFYGDDELIKNSKWYKGLLKMGFDVELTWEEETRLRSMGIFIKKQYKDLHLTPRLEYWVNTHYGGSSDVLRALRLSHNKWSELQRLNKRSDYYKNFGNPRAKVNNAEDLLNWIKTFYLDALKYEKVLYKPLSQKGFGKEDFIPYTNIEKLVKNIFDGDLSYTEFVEDTPETTLIEINSWLKNHREYVEGIPFPGEDSFYDKSTRKYSFLRELNNLINKHN